MFCFFPNFSWHIPSESFFLQLSDLNNLFFEAVNRCRCVLVVLSPDMLNDTNCVFCLNNVISQVNRTYVVSVALARDLDLINDDHLSRVTAEVKAHISHIRRPIAYQLQATSSNQAHAENTSSFDKMEKHCRFVLFRIQIRLATYRQSSGLVYNFG